MREDFLLVIWLTYSIYMGDNTLIMGTVNTTTYPHPFADKTIQPPRTQMLHNDQLPIRAYQQSVRSK